GIRGFHVTGVQTCALPILFQVEFLASLSGDLLVTLVYHRKLDAIWESAAQQLRDELQAVQPTLSIIGRSRKQKLVVGEDFIEEEIGRASCRERVESRGRGQ